MKKTLIAISLVATLAVTQQSHANEKNYAPENKEQAEFIGFGSGILAGAAIGGPIGAFVGGVMGIMIADDVNDNKAMTAQLTALDAAEKEIQQQTQQVVALKTDLHDLKNEQMVQAVNFEESQQTLLQERIANLQTNIQFQTASVAIEDVYQPQLAGIADLLNQFPELTARLEGYADQRGDSDFNQALSIARAEAVANLLLEMNVDKSQLTYAGNGEAVNRDLTQAPKESLFFDRRVNIQILPKGQIMTAAK